MTGCPPGPEIRAAPAERERVLAAVFDLVLERGYRETTAAAVCERSQVTPASFVEFFGDVQTCVALIYDEINERVEEPVVAAFEAEPRWRDALRAAAYAAADYFAEHPREVRFCTVELLNAGEMVAVRRDANLQRFVDLIDAGRCELPEPEAVGRGVAESVLGAIFERLLRTASQRANVSRAREMVPELMYIAVRPYVGHAEAMKEFTIPRPAPRGSPD